MCCGKRASNFALIKSQSEEYAQSWSVFFDSAVSAFLVHIVQTNIVKLFTKLELLVSAPQKSKSVNIDKINKVFVLSFFAFVRLPNLDCVTTNLMIRTFFGSRQDGPPVDSFIFVQKIVETQWKPSLVGPVSVTLCLTIKV